jgi:peptidyl-prolyl cis-trans isomerase D
MSARVIAIWAIVGSVVLGLVIAFGLPIASSQPAGAVAEVDGEPISRDSFEAFRRTNEALAGSQLESVDPNLLRDLLDRQTLDQLIQRAVLAQEALALGLRVSDDELRLSVRSDTRFQSDGKFDAELFRRYAQSSDFGPALTEEMRRDLLIAKFQRLLVSPIRVSSAAAAEALRREKTRLRLRYAAALVEDFRPAVQVEDAEVQTLAERAPERIQELYERRRPEFQRLEEVRVRQILFRGPEATERARETLEAIQAGQSFEAMARERSEDEATRDQGGDLGFFSRGRLHEALDQAAFALRPGQLSEPIETPRGVHLLRVEERRPALDRSIDDVRLELARELALDEAARRAAREAADRLGGRLQAGEEFLAASESTGLRLGETPSFGASEPVVPELGPLPGLLEVASRLSSERPVSPRVLEGPRGFYLVALLERHEPDATELEGELPATRDRLEARAQNDTIGLWLASRLRELDRDAKIVRYPLYP